MGANMGAQLLLLTLLASSPYRSGVPSAYKRCVGWMVDMSICSAH